VQAGLDQALMMLKMMKVMIMMMLPAEDVATIQSLFSLQTDY
jgi:hypothetical protein